MILKKRLEEQRVGRAIRYGITLYNTHNITARHEFNCADKFKAIYTMVPSTNNNKKAATQQGGQSDKRQKVTSNGPTKRKSRNSNTLDEIASIVQQCDADSVFEKRDRAAVEGSRYNPSKASSRVSVEANIDCMPSNNK